MEKIMTKIFFMIILVLSIPVLAQEEEQKANASHVTVPFEQASPVSNITGRVADFYFSDFESDNGGWASAGYGDWEYGSVVSGAFSGCDNSTEPEPAGSNSGSNCWATVLNGCYANSSNESILTQTFDFSGLSGTIEMSWYQWHHVFYDFDTGKVYANGDLVWELTSSDPTADWGQQIADLSAYAGNAAVTITFELHASSVVNKMGWYIDDIRIQAGAGGAGASTVPTMGEYGLLGLFSLLCMASIVMMRKAKNA